MKTIIKYPFRQRTHQLLSLPFPQLLKLKSSSLISPSFSHHCLQKQSTLKQAMLSFLPSNSLSFLTRIFNHTYPLLPKFIFPNIQQTPSVLNLQIAISSILIGDFINQLSRIDNKIFKKYVPDKYLLLSADFFHIKGSVYGSMLGKPEISYNMGCIEAELSKASLKNLPSESLKYSQSPSHPHPSKQSLSDKIQQFCNYITWRSAPHRYGYHSLLLLQTQKTTSHQILAYHLGLLQSLRRFLVQPSLIKSFTNSKQPELCMEKGREEIVVECLISELEQITQEQSRRGEV